MQFKPMVLSSQSELAKKVAFAAPFAAVRPSAAEYIAKVIVNMLLQLQPILRNRSCVPLESQCACYSVM
jgi:hypothetical protein